jgi:beta-alanine degradation protein BauB
MICPESCFTLSRSCFRFVFRSVFLTPTGRKRWRVIDERIVTMLSAKSDVQIDAPEVRVTEWRLAPGSATGRHIHEMDYVIVPVTAGEMTIVAPSGERSKAQLAVGKSYFRKAGVEHDVLNETTQEIVFLEVELKP